MKLDLFCLYFNVESQDQRMVEDTPAFIRALTTAVTESAIDGKSPFFSSFITDVLDD